MFDITKRGGRKRGGAEGAGEENPMDKSRQLIRTFCTSGTSNLGTNFLGPPRLKSGALDHPRESGQGIENKPELFKLPG